MSEKDKNMQTGEQQEQQKDPKEKAREQINAMLAQATRGEIALHKPMLSRNVEVKVLHYDFSKLSNKDIIESIDSDRTNMGRSQLTAKQAVYLYGRMHSKVEVPISGLDMTDIEQQASQVDLMAMVQAAMSFFTLLYNAAYRSIS